MSERATELATRHAELLRSCAAQRHAVAGEVVLIEARLGGVDRVATVARYTVLHPAVITAGTVALLTLGRVRGLRLIGRLVLLTTAARRLWQVAKVL